MERWKQIPGYAGAYEVSDSGRVRSTDRGVKRKDGVVVRLRGKVLAQNSCGAYKNVTLSAGGKTSVFWVHRLVLETFVGAGGKREVCRHINHNGCDNRLPNLRWGSYTDNEEDKIRAGRKPVGSSLSFSKLDESQVARIKQRLRGGASMAAMAREYGVSEGTIQNIKVGRTWKHVAG